MINIITFSVLEKNISRHFTYYTLYITAKITKYDGYLVLQENTFADTLTLQENTEFSWMYYCA